MNSFFRCFILSGVMMLIALAGLCQQEEPSTQLTQLPKLLTVPFVNKSPEIDGIITPEEWYGALEIGAKMPLFSMDEMEEMAESWEEEAPPEIKPAEFHHITIYMMNDMKNLYLAIHIIDEDYNDLFGKEEEEEEKEEMEDYEEDFDYDCLSISFDSNNNLKMERDEDIKMVFFADGEALYVDDYYKPPFAGSITRDVQEDGRAAARHSNPEGKGDYFIEIEIPLKSGDKQDLAVNPGDKMRFNLIYMDHCSLLKLNTLIGGFFGIEEDATDMWGQIELSGKPQPQEK